MKKIIYLTISILLLSALITLQILGSKERAGYLSDFEIIEKSATNYIYNFRIRYYDKVFRNSDIYGVYLLTNNLPEYITKIKMNELGSPFGIFTSTKIIEEEKIDNINYILRLKSNLVCIIIIIAELIILFHFVKTELLKLFIKLKNRFVLILILFLCFLIMPNIIYKIFYEHFDHINYENRTLASKPILVSTNINEYPKNYEEYFNDYLPFKTELVKLKNLSDIFVFKNVFDSRVLLGKNKWLFNREDNLTEKYIGIEKYNFTKEELETAKSNLIHFRDELKKKNIDFIFMVCPSKQFIYNEYMPNYIKRKSTKNGTDIFVEYIKNNTDIKVVYPKEELLKYKDKFQLYYKYDTHWNSLGAYIGYMELAKILNINNKNINDLKILEFDSSSVNRSLKVFYNNISKMLGLNNIKYFKDDAIYILEDYKHSLTNDFDKWRENKILKYDLYNSSNIMVIRDSYFFEVLPYMSEVFKQVEYIHLDYFKNENIMEYKPDIVVFESVEYGLKHRVLNVMPNYKIEEINEE